jgi:hypothetical protein
MCRGRRMGAGRFDARSGKQQDRPPHLSSCLSVSCRHPSPSAPSPLASRSALKTPATPPLLPPPAPPLLPPPPQPANQESMRGLCCMTGLGAGGGPAAASAAARAAATAETSEADGPRARTAARAAGRLAEGM